MKVVILSSDRNHPAVPYYANWCTDNNQVLAFEADALPDADYLFALSCTEIIPAKTRKRFKHCITIHESDLPAGRGWSPWAWQIIEGATTIPLTMIEMVDEVDAGPCYQKNSVFIPATDLSADIHKKLALAKLSMIDRELEHGLELFEQKGDPTYYRRRVPADSLIDSDKSIAEQFNILRICDDRFPAFFYYLGSKYKISIERANE